MKRIAPAFIDALEGLSKRELFAILAMQGLLSQERFGTSYASIAAAAVKYADDLLRALKENPDNGK